MAGPGVARVATSAINPTTSEGPLGPGQHNRPLAISLGLLWSRALDLPLPRADSLAAAVCSVQLGLSALLDCAVADLLGDVVALLLWHLETFFGRVLAFCRLEFFQLFLGKAWLVCADLKKRTKILI